MSDDQEITANLPATTTMDFPDALPLMPLDDMVVFPLAIVPLSVSDKEEVLL